MELLRTSRGHADNSLLIPQRKEVASPVNAVEHVQNSPPRSQESRGTKQLTWAREEIQLALTELEHATRGTTNSASNPYKAVLPNRARQAIDAYLAHQNHPQHEAQSALRQMLGVDFFV